MQRANPKKNKRKDPIHKPAKSPHQIVAMTNYFNLAVMVRTLFLVNGWNFEQINEFIESYVVLLEEVGGKRTTVWEFIKDTKEMTGIDVQIALENVCNSFDV